VTQPPRIFGIILEPFGARLIPFPPHLYYFHNATSTAPVRQNLTIAGKDAHGPLVQFSGGLSVRLG